MKEMIVMALLAVATYSSPAQASDWRSMDSAPRDGTVIEVRCTYGIAPWYGLYKWGSGEMIPYIECRNGECKPAGVKKDQGPPHWISVDRVGFSFDEGPSFSWRPYKGETQGYVDPTGGAQYSNQYWLNAAGRH